MLNDLGIEYTKNSEGAKYSRAKIPVDAKAAGIASIDAIWQDLKDLKGLENDCKAGKNLGYTGKSLIHPDQISTVEGKMIDEVHFKQAEAILKLTKNK